MMDLFHVYLQLAGAVLLYMAAWFGFSILKKRSDVADVAWGLGFILVAVLSFLWTGLEFDRGLLVTVLVGIWGLRLATHIYLRNHGKAEDYRYKTWREQWGKWFYPRTFLQVFVFQGIMLLLVVSPVVVTNTFRGGPLGLLDLLGVLIWVTGFLFESIGDYQLTQFMKNPLNKGKLMRSGLWQYTRHPNYFGEVMEWWGLWVIALSVPHGILGIIGPLTITFLILKISGIPLLEQKMELNPEFAEYKAQTSMFIPMPRKQPIQK